MKAKLIATAALLLCALGGHTLAQDADPRIEASKKEGSLLIYGTSDPSSWKGIFDAYNSHYPWVKVEALNLGSLEVLERYRAESSTGVKTADLLVAGAPDKFVLASDQGAFLAYTPPGIESFPTFTHPLPDVFTIAPEPMILIYNKALLPEPLWPKGFQDLADKVAANPDVFKGKVASFDPLKGVGVGVNIAMARILGEDKFWSSFTKIAPALRVEPGAGAMLDKVTTGEYVVAYYPARFAVVPLLKDGRDAIVGNNFFDDAQPFQLRAMGITRAGSSPNAAKLFVDFVMSEEGQRANALSGNTPFNPNLQNIEGVTSYADVVKAVGGEDKIALYGYERSDIAAVPAYLDRASKILGR